MIVKEGSTLPLKACGTVTVVDGFVSFCCSSADLSIYPILYTGYMEAGSNSMCFCSIAPSATYHSHTADEINYGMFSGPVCACQDESSQDPYTPLLRNTMLTDDEEAFPEYEGEIYWTYE